jgi:hypothetical protein
MISPQALIQLKAFARQDGFILSLIWLLSMWMYIKVFDSIIGPLLMFSTPFFMIWRLNAFRDTALNGHISLRRSIAYSCYVFFYASLTFAIGQYIYFRYLDGGDFIKLIEMGKEYIIKNNQTLGMNVNDLDIAVKTIGMMNPIQLVFSFMMNNLVIGAFLSPIVALISKMTEKRNK